MEQEYKYLVCTRCYTFNHAHYIVDAMDGFAKQKTTFPVVTVIVDDASTDGEPEVIRQYLQENFHEPYRQEETVDYYLICADHISNSNCTFIVFLLKYNHHRLKKSKLPYSSEWSNNAKYIALCEGDDYWIASNKLQWQITFLESHPSYVMSHTAIRYYFERDNKFYESNDIQINSKIIQKGLTPEKILQGYRIQLCSVIIQTKAYLDAKKSDPYLFGGNFKMGDTQLWYQLLKIGDIFFFPEVCCVYRKHEGSSTKAESKIGRLMFSLSSAELRMYLAKRDNLSSVFNRYVNIWYSKAFIKCLAFDNSLKSRYPVNLKADKCLYYLFKLHLLKPYLCVSMGCKTWLFAIKRIIMQKV